MAMRRFLRQVWPTAQARSISDGLKKLYFQILKPVEETYHFNDFFSPFLTESEFEAKPQIMVLGQYSTGKTSFIKHLLNKAYPGAYIGPEPTTDRFVAVMNGVEERVIPGNAAVVQLDLPFNGLRRFGSSFLAKFECAQMPHPLLQHFTFIDTPGVLSGEKQRMNRSYDFPGVAEWFASKCDLILLMFDPYKLDISDEFKDVIKSLHGHNSKIRLLLNKADSVDTQQLMRVYGALMWSLGKVIQTPEVMRVYIGSFGDLPFGEKIIDADFGKELFKREQEDLLQDLMSIPKKSCDRRVNEFVKRAEAVKVHAFIIGHLRSEMPRLIGKSKKKFELVQNLEAEFYKIQAKHHIPYGDFPNVERLRNTLTTYDFDKLPRLKQRLIQSIDDMLSNDIPQLLQEFENTDMAGDLGSSIETPPLLFQN